MIDRIIHQPRMLSFSEFPKQQKPQTVQIKELFEATKQNFTVNRNQVATGRALLAKIELLENLPILLKIFLFQIIKQTSTLADEFQQASA